MYCYGPGADAWVFAAEIRRWTYMCHSACFDPDRWFPFKSPSLERYADVCTWLHMPDHCEEKA